MCVARGQGTGGKRAPWPCAHGARGPPCQTLRRAVPERERKIVCREMWGREAKYFPCVHIGQNSLFGNNLLNSLHILVQL